MLFAVPPLMVFIPAMLPFRIEIASAGISVGAVIAVVMNRFIKPCFGLFDRVLAGGAIFGVHEWNCNKPGERNCHNGGHCGFCEALNQDISPSDELCLPITFPTGLFDAT
jgi:hypothetical protein